MAIVAALLSPIIWAMDLVLGLLHGLTGSYGLAIILLSLLVRLLTAPITHMAAAAEAREQAVQRAMAPALERARRELRGRERFERVEAIYLAHGYHPIRSVLSLAPIGLQLPFLLSALFLLIDSDALQGIPFLVISDLARADQLLPLWPGLAVNLLPILITVVALTESLVRPEQTRAMRARFLIVAVVIAALIYPLPAGVCLYWLASNVWSLVLTLAVRARMVDRQ